MDPGGAPCKANYRCTVTPDFRRSNTAKVRPPDPSYRFDPASGSRTCSPDGCFSTPRPRTCALRRRRFSRSAAARRASRPPFCGDFLAVVSSAMAHPYRREHPAGKACALPCTAQGLVAVIARVRAPGSQAARLFRCRSSVVEHPLGKGEVECSIHSGSTISATVPEPTAGYRPLFAECLVQLPVQNLGREGLEDIDVGNSAFGIGNRFGDAVAVRTGQDGGHPCNFFFGPDHFDQIRP